LSPRILRKAAAGTLPAFVRRRWRGRPREGTSPFGSSTTIGPSMAIGELIPALSHSERTLP